MPRSPCLFRESDVRRAVKAARSSGLEIGGIEFDLAHGRITILPKNISNQEQDLENWLTKHARPA
jgi:hypothetical protein